MVETNVATLGKAVLPLFRSQDFFMPDPVDYAAALGPKGLGKYQAELDKIAATVPAEMGEPEKQAAR